VEKGFLLTQARLSLPFMALAVAFLALGVAGNNVFFALALAFFVISIVSMRRPQR
jgi:hypothetical protein